MLLWFPKRFIRGQQDGSVAKMPSTKPVKWNSISKVHMVETDYGLLKIVLQSQQICIDTPIKNTCMKDR